MAGDGSANRDVSGSIMWNVFECYFNVMRLLHILLSCFNRSAKSSNLQCGNEWVTASVTVEHFRSPEGTLRCRARL